jgi:gluconokinase
MADDKLLVMGVAGSGKSTLAAALAGALGAALIEGDDHHPPQSQDKMRRGIALQDSDREPWLARLGELLAAQRGGAVLTCSALKRRYRDQLRAAVSGLRIVYLDITLAESQARVAARPNHFFGAGLVASQFESLEVPVDEPGVLHVPASQTPTMQLQLVLQRLDGACDDNLPSDEERREPHPQEL